MKLAERGTKIKELWVRETRRLSHNGHQTSIISTAYRLELGTLAMGMFARWSQENFFKYMRQNFSLDRLVEYTVEELPGDTKVVNPKYRHLDGEVRRKAAKLARKTALFGSITISGEIIPEKVEEYQKRKAELHEEIVIAQKEIEDLKSERKATTKHVLIAELPLEERLQRLCSKSKDFLDTVKMICYRAETAMVNIARESLSRAEDARNFIKSLYQTEVDIIPNVTNGVLKIKLHHLTNRSSDIVAQRLCSALNETETIFPGTKLRIVYEMVSS